MLRSIGLKRFSEDNSDGSWLDPETDASVKG
jgi:hypothetical protein